jgi:hypothetical protein
MIFNYIFSSTVYLLNKVETDKLRCKNIAYLAINSQRWVRYSYYEMTHGRLYKPTRESYSLTSTDIIAIVFYSVSDPNKNLLDTNAITPQNLNVI